MERRQDLDFLKGIAIIAVILFHIGILPFGFLGVEIFFVISGFLIIPPVVDKIVNDDFHYFSWIRRRLVRLLPLVVIVCAASLVIGYYFMTPDDYVDLAQSTVASEMFANNILLAITTMSYWALENEYKPLLALWYLGVLIQFFIFFPLILKLILKCVAKYVENQSRKKALLISLFVIAIISFILYSMPSINGYYKHYGMPFRIWEFCMGAFAYYCADHFKRGYKTGIYMLLLVIILIVLCMDFTPLQNLNHLRVVGSYGKTSTIPESTALIISVIISSLLIIKKVKISRLCVWMVYIGKMSLSLFIWHQLILAYMRYFYADTMTLPIFIIYLMCVMCVSVISYHFLENIRIDNLAKRCALFIGWGAVLCCSAYIIYTDGDMIEPTAPGMKQGYIRRVDGARYEDRIFDYDKPFSTDKPKVLVVGNSFARDLANCLKEWDNRELLEISYIYVPDSTDTERYSQADYMFYFGDKTEVPQWIWDSIRPDCDTYGIGTKNYGKIIGAIYFKMRHGDYDFSLSMSQRLKATNDKWKASWGEDHYIDFVEASLNEKGEIRVFTPDSMLISFDCLHLAPAGARYFSSRLGFDEIFGSTNSNIK